jgi:hypothetical protein
VSLGKAGGVIDAGVDELPACVPKEVRMNNVARNYT